MVEGEWAGRVTGLGNQRVEIAMMVTPDGHSRLELSRFLTPSVVADHRKAPVNALGYLRAMYGERHRRDTRQAPQARCAARRRSGPVRGFVSALLHPRPRRTSHRTGRTTRSQSVTVGQGLLPTHHFSTQIGLPDCTFIQGSTAPGEDIGSLRDSGRSASRAHVGHSSHFGDFLEAVDPLKRGSCDSRLSCLTYGVHSRTPNRVDSQTFMTASDTDPCSARRRSRSRPGTEPVWKRGRPVEPMQNCDKMFHHFRFSRSDV